jgi:glucose/arabinose dehydrogenase
MRTSTFLLSAAALVLGGAVARPGGQAPAVPAAQSTDRATQTFALQCAGCHGDALEGARAGSLLDERWTYGGDDASLVRTIREGRADAGMPAFGGELDEARTREIVYMIRNLAARAKGRPATRATPAVEGVVTSARHTFRIETITDALETPWAVAVLPDGRLLVTERPGRLRVIERGRLLPDPVEGVPAVWTVQDGGLFDVEVHPRFGENGWVYLAYAEPREPKRSNTVVVRGRLAGHRLVDLVTIARWPDEWYVTSSVHYGSRFIFDRDGFLYFSIGDRGQADRSQDLSAPVGKIHRVTADGAPAPGNPFAGRAGALPTIWSYGNRNPQGFAWHPVTGELWETEHGPRGGDEVNVIRPGANYGWPVVSFGILDTWVSAAANGKATAATTMDGMESPITHYTPSPGISPRLFYTGDAFPAWKNELLVGMMRDEELRRLTIDGHRVVAQEVLFRGLGRVRDLAMAADGSIYVALATPGAAVSDTTAGRVVRLQPVK